MPIVKCSLVEVGVSKNDDFPLSNVNVDRAFAKWIYHRKATHIDEMEYLIEQNYLYDGWGWGWRKSSVSLYET
jgi:hypothetical protein